MSTIEETIADVMAPGKGMLVADEYAEALVRSMGDDGRPRRFAEILVSTPDLSRHLSSVLLTGPTFAQVTPHLQTTSTRPLVGVRLAVGTEPRFADHVREWASFVEWRAHLFIPDLPRGAVHIDAPALADGAAAAQAEGILPVISVAMPDLGSASIGVTQAVISNALSALREHLEKAGVDPAQLVLRTSMIAAGEGHATPSDPEQVAERTLAVLERCVPAATAGVLLLSGGQTLDRACANLAAITSLASRRPVPWPVTFGFSRALVRAAAGYFSAPDADAGTTGRLLAESIGRAAA